MMICLDGTIGRTGIQKVLSIMTRNSEIVQRDSHELPSLGAKTYFQNKAFEPTIHKPVDDCKAFD